MKIKYRILFSDNYTEVKCDSFSFYNNENATEDELGLVWIADGGYHWVVNVCEVCVEEV